MKQSRWRRFLLPDLNRSFALRLVLVAVAAAVVFTQVLIPFRIQGKSMEPTYRDGGFNFCWRARYLFAEPERGDVVAIRFAGQRIMLLKRIVGLAGDTVEFRNGALFVNDTWVKEPHLRSPSDWNLAARRVEPGKVYVVGDNRIVPLDRQSMGQVERARIVGGVLW
ncbi:MAG: signal peptidase I [Desulfobulbus sp.]|jgi:signal peptidase I|uniref:signal peptidase I n=1 Tax=Desulfobulbus sp. TaxID=895 RepID=UPI00283FF814|nr:signal peptidase I [Desulfobulbus sp.]MDR2549200.1 signal peptidase I [Desulfobulbus sp.]